MSGEPRLVCDGLFEVGGDGSVCLLAGRCGACGAAQFPRPIACAACGGGTAELRLDGRGASLWGWTSVQAAPPGYLGPVPYGFGVVELPEGLRVVTRLVTDFDTDSGADRAVVDFDALSFGQPMRLVTEVVDHDGDGVEVVAWAFAPDEVAEGER